jgi:sporulation protein YlmC with PRC-barrel domain
MNKFISATGLAAVMVISLGTVRVAAETMIQPDEMRANKFIGASVYDRQNQDVASVEDLILEKDGKVSSVVLSYGSTAGIGGKYIAVGFSDFKFNNDRLTVDQTKEQLEALPPFQLVDKTTGAGKRAVPPVGGHATGQGEP